MAYSPEPIGNAEGPQLIEWILRELRRVSVEFSLGEVRQIQFRASAPSKLKEGMICAADGTNWNPGGGKGVYCYYSGAWNKLG